MWQVDNNHGLLVLQVDGEDTGELQALYRVWWDIAHGKPEGLLMEGVLHQPGF